MQILTLIYNKLILSIQILLVMTFVVFEELIWDVFAKPIYEYILNLKILKSLQKRLQSVNRYVILVMFVILFAIVELAGIYAGILAIRGDILYAIVLYLSKIPIAAFTFWLFGATKEKLLSFGWFNWTYEKIISLFERIKQTEIYRRIKEILSIIKRELQRLKALFVSKEHSASDKFKAIYRYLKNEYKK